MSTALPDLRIRKGRIARALGARASIALDAVICTVPLLTLLVVIAEWNGIPGQPLRDSSAYHAAAAAARTGSDIYDPLPPPGPHEFRGNWPYLYPPPLAALLSLLPDMTYRTFDRFWLCLNAASFWGFAAALAKIATGGWTIRGTLRWGALAFIFPGTWLGIHFGNIDTMVLALVAVALAWPGFAGAGLALAAIFKVSAVWALLMRLLRSPRSTVTSAAAASVACALACFAVFGMPETFALSLRWARDVMPTVSQGQFWGGSLAVLRSGLSPVHYTGNLSLSFLPVQVAVLNGWPYDGGTLPDGVRVYLTATGILAPLMAGWFTRHRSATLQAAVVFAVTLFAAPIVRPYVLPVLLLVAAAVLSEHRGARVIPVDRCA